MKHITSPHNALIRQAEQLQRKSKVRKKEQLFLIEGAREITLAIKGGYQLQTLLVCPEIFNQQEQVSKEFVQAQLGVSKDVEIISVSIEVYEKLAYRSGTEGCIAFAKAKTLQLTDLNLPNNALVLVAQSIEKPGNLGALLRTADAAAVDAVLLADPKCDLYNPNVIRSSVGCALTVPIANASTSDICEFLRTKKIDLYAATLQTSIPYHTASFKNSSAIAVGTEATGLTDEMRDAAKANIIIPMSGEIDSMNVSVSAAILLFEAKRQRDF